MRKIIVSLRGIIGNWEFGIPEDFCDLSMEVYVKIKELLHVDNMMCMSFHKAQYPITYPYRTT